MKLFGTDGIRGLAGEPPLDRATVARVGAALVRAAGGLGRPMRVLVGRDTRESGAWIEEELGRGGSATVYLAQDLRHGRRVALKVLHSALGAALGVERFQREIRTHARLQHPHILPLYDSGTAAGRLYYTMPYVEAGTLRDRLRRAGRLTPPAAVQLALEVASALAYAHRLGIIHRDLKPENIFLTHDNRPKILDFGLARSKTPMSLGESALTVEVTQPGRLLGTIGYMAPEQVRGEEADAPADIFALGCIAYQLLTGVHPFRLKPINEAVAAGIRPEPIGDIDPDAWRAIDSALAFDRDARLPSVDIFMAAVFDG